MTALTCEFCTNAFPIAPICPHCGRPGIFPNVEFAKADEGALDARFRESLATLAAAGKSKTADLFQQQVAGSRAVISRSLSEVFRIAASEEQSFGTRGITDDAGLSAPSASTMAKLRGIAEAVLFPGYGRNVRYAALSISGRGLGHYGDCSLALRPELIAHRASVFEDDSAGALVGGSDAGNALELGSGRRATWARRSDLALAKHSAELAVLAGPADLEAEALILAQRGGGSPDTLIEVHIWGSITIRTVESIIVHSSPGGSGVGRMRLDGLRELCDVYDVDLEVER